MMHPSTGPSDSRDQRVRAALSLPEWEVYEPLISRINELKKQRSAIILGHNYMSPEIFHGVSDLCGDSLALARLAYETDAATIVMAGVHFMAETAKILSPDKTVLIPDMKAGCSLAESITPEDIAGLRRAHPGVPVVTYVNTSAAVKAASDICCTSGNAVAVVRSLNVPRVIFLPDEFLGRWVATQCPETEIILWNGHCEVHERFSGKELRLFRKDHEGVAMLAHPECPPDVLEEADYVGSTAAMIEYVRQHQPPRVALITECAMSDNVAVEFPQLDFVRPCTFCPHMKRITLEAILTALETMQHPVEIPEKIATPASRSLTRMLAVNPPA